MAATPDRTTELVLVFDAAGRRLGATRATDEVFDPPVRSFADLQSRLRTPDGSAADLGGMADAGVEVTGPGGRSLLTLEPLPVDQTAGWVIVRLVEDGDLAVVGMALGAVLSHELRTPLTTIYGGVQLLATGGVPEATRREAAASVLRASEHLNRIADDLVFFVRPAVDPAAAGEPILLAPILRTEVDRRRGPARSGQPGADGAEASEPLIELHVSPGLPPVLGSPELASHLVANVLDDAIAGSPPGGRVIVEAAANAGWVEVRVADSGRARDGAAAAAAFELFEPARRARGDASGANLGLAVARRLAERLGGLIDATANAPGGELVVRLPIAGGAGATEAAGRM